MASIDFNKLSTLGINCGLNPVSQVPRRFDEIAKAGFKYLYFNDIFFLEENKTKLRTVKQAVDNSGLKVHSSHFLHTLPAPWESMEGILDRHKRHLDIAALFGMRFVTTHFGWMRGFDNPRLVKKRIFKAYLKNPIQNLDLLYNEAISKVGGIRKFMEMNYQVYHHLCVEAKKRGISPTIETACCKRTNTPAQIIRITRKIGCPNLGICLDSGHSHARGVDVPKSIRDAGKYLFETHFHDNFGDVDLHRPVGLGTINWLEVIRALADIGYKDVINFESGGWVEDSYPQEVRRFAANWHLFLQIAKRLEKTQKG